ncbi:MAG: extracellular solute-binding protein [Chloroflexota bacterium]|nr:extracellular solute-binding protein [Chloroflexota bacterium]
MLRRAYVRAATAAWGATLLGACSTDAASQAGQAGQPTRDAGLTGRIAVMTGGGAAEEAALKPVFGALAARHPRLTVEYTPGGTGGVNAAYNEKLASLLASGAAPDVFKSAPFGFGQFAHASAYLALDDRVRRQVAEVKPEDFFSSHLEGSKYGGKLYALSQSGAPQALWLNVDLWQREGLPLPTWDSGWADLLRAGQALTKRDGDSRATQLGLSRPDWVSWIWSAGGDLYNAEGTRMLIDQPAAIEALTWLQDAVHKYRVAPTAEELADAGLSGFPNGRLGVNVANRGALGMYRAIDGFTYDAAPLPKGPKGRVAHTAVGHTSVWSGSKAPDAAFAVLNFVCGVEGQRLYYADGFGHPSRRSVTQETWFKEFKTPRAASNRINTVFPDTLTRNEARAITPHPREADINQAVLRNLAALWNGARTPRDVAAAIMAETSPMMLK